MPNANYGYEAITTNFGQRFVEYVTPYGPQGATREIPVHGVRPYGSGYGYFYKGKLMYASSLPIPREALDSLEFEAEKRHALKEIRMLNLQRNRFQRVDHEEIMEEYQGLNVTLEHIFGGNVPPRMRTTTNAVTTRNITTGSIQSNGVKEMNREQAEALAAQAATALARIAEKEAKFGADVYNDGTIMYADLKFRTVGEAVSKRARKYRYAFIKAGGFWYSSGPNSGGVRWSWDELIDWLDKMYIVRLGFTKKEAARIKNDKLTKVSN